MADVEAKLLFEGQPSDATLRLFLKYASLAERQLQSALRRMDKLTPARSASPSTKRYLNPNRTANPPKWNIQ